MTNYVCVLLTYIIDPRIFLLYCEGNFVLILNSLYILSIMTSKLLVLKAYDFNNYLFLYLFINYHTITYYLLIINELSNFGHVVGVVLQTRFSFGNQSHDSPMLIV